MMEEGYNYVEGEQISNELNQLTFKERFILMKNILIVVNEKIFFSIILLIYISMNPLIFLAMN